MVKINRWGSGAHYVSPGSRIDWSYRPFQLPSQSIALGSFVTLEEKTDEGWIILAHEPAWRKISEALVSNPNALHELTPRQFEELVAAGYEKDGYEVTLTPQSGDFGRDVIAVKKGYGCIRIIDQVKKYSPGHLVTANDVRALLGVLVSDRNATKGVVTTTSSFAPLVTSDPLIAPYIPYRLSLIDGHQLITQMAKLNSKQ